MLEKGWLKRQMESAATTTEKWPDWMKQEAGIHQPQTTGASKQQEQTAKEHSELGSNSKEAVSA